MTEKKHDKELEALNKDVASIREDLAALIASVRNLAAEKAGEALSGTEQKASHAESGAAEPWFAGWTEFQQKIEEARARGAKALKDFSSEIERHPLGSLAVAFGIGFIIAKLLEGRTKSEDINHHP